MNDTSATIPKQPALPPAQDFYALRRTGIGFIEEMASSIWTDYNEHDPGITIHEAVCYAITDLAFRMDWEVKDLLTPKAPPSDLSHPYPHQAFFTAREILTVNPTTPDDFRRLLIDLELVRNAWIFCKKCPCDVSWYAWCENDQLQLAYQPPTTALPFKEVWALGLYEALLELEEDPHLGDLNDRKIVGTLSLHDGGAHSIILELRFPQAALSDHDVRALFLDSDDAFGGKNGESFDLKLTAFGAAKSYDLFSDPNLDADGRNGYLRRHWRNVFYASFEIKLNPSGKTIAISNAGLRFFGDNAARDAATADDVRTFLLDQSPDGFILRYRKKEQQKELAVESAKEALQAHRNLDEDYCRVRIVGIDEVAVCADVEVTPDADIEAVQARIWFEIERYFNPPVPFYSLQELLDAGVPVEEIFNGPELDNGFIRNEDLAAASLKTVLRVSDIIDLLMDIDGVVAVNQLQLTRYDSEGNPVSGAADPTWIPGTPNPVFDPNKTSAFWLLYLAPQHQPRLYLNGSRFFFTKDGLPFLPRMDEALDTLTQLRGEAERPKIKTAPKDLPVPLGLFRDPDQYFPVQYSFPLTYGIGPDGLSVDASPPRRAQAKQLKAYLMVFEQILGNAFAQLAHVADLFSLDTSVVSSYFVKEFKEEMIKGYNDIVTGLSAAKLKAMVETVPEFHDRRNRFLDHILARFGEQFSDYALLLTSLEGTQVALDRLIDDKIAFVEAYPAISHDRGKAFDYTRPLADPQVNIPGIKRRVSLLLGYPDLAFSWDVVPATAFQYDVTFKLADRQGKVLLDGSLTVVSDTADSVVLKASREVLVQLVQPDAYAIVPDGAGFRLTVKDGSGNPLASSPDLLDTKAQAQLLEDELLAWSANERLIVVEHLLLRPKFVGDVLFPACVEGTCETCGVEDPYSFRLTFVMPGWTAPFNTNMEMRRYAERVIRQETPSHLLPKICWVGNDGFLVDLCDPIVEELSRLLETKGKTGDGGIPSRDEACACAGAIYKAFSDVFKGWYADKTLEYICPDTLKAALKALFDQAPDLSTISCTTVLQPLWDEIKALMVAFFLDVALYGWQFERFEDAWNRWLEVNAGFDWTEEHLSEDLQALLAENVASVAASVSLDKRLSADAAAMLTQYGVQFHDLMAARFKTGDYQSPLPQFQVDLPPASDGITFNAGIADLARAFLEGRYQEYREVSYRLWVVVNLLGKLRNTYPPATLHDCDEGNDKNPVRLGLTALGR